MRELPARRMSGYLSRKLRLLSLLSMVIVVICHVCPKVFPDHGQSAGGFPGPAWMSYYLAGSLARINRPIFYGISGFLFFYTLKPTLAGFAVKWKKRSFSLLFPYLLWSSLGLAVVLCLTQIPSLAGFLGRNAHIANETPRGFLRVLLMDPVPYQLWYIRNLMFYTALTPLIYLGLQRSPALLAMAAVATWFAGIGLPQFIPAATWFILPGLCFFCFGAVLAQYPSLLEGRFFSQRHAALLVMGWLALAGIDTQLHLSGHEYRFLVNKLGTSLGVLAVWALYDHLPRALARWIAPWSHLVFFVYLSHEPLLTALWKAARHTAPILLENPYLALIWLGALTMAVCLAVGQRLHDQFRIVYYYLAGGRIKPARPPRQVEHRPLSLAALH